MSNTSKNALNIAVEDPRTGKKVEGKFTVNSSIPKVNLGRGAREEVSTDGLLRIALGEKPTKEQLEKTPALSQVTTEFAKEFITRCAVKGSNLVTKLSLIAALLLSAIGLNAQVQNGRYDALALDTLTNADTIVWEFPNYIPATDEYEWTYQIKADSLDGTPSFTVYIQETFFNSSGTKQHWVNTDTIAVSGIGTVYNAFASGTQTATYHRAYIVSDSTQSTSLQAYRVIARKEF